MEPRKFLKCTRFSTVTVQALFSWLWNIPTITPQSGVRSPGGNREFSPWRIVLLITWTSRESCLAELFRWVNSFLCSCPSDDVDLQVEVSWFCSVQLTTSDPNCSSPHAAVKVTGRRERNSPAFPDIKISLLLCGAWSDSFMDFNSKQWMLRQIKPMQRTLRLHLNWITASNFLLSFYIPSVAEREEGMCVKPPFHSRLSYFFALCVCSLDVTGHSL